MRAFAYARPATLADAVALLEEHGPAATLLAGGTDVVVALRNRTLRCETLIDLKGVAELRPSIEEAGQSMTINATTVLSDLNDDARVQARYPALVEAAATVGSKQIRNRATLTGNICHASPAADTAPALLVYEAALNTASARGTRRIPVGEFFVGPGKTVLEPGELVTSIELPAAGQRRAATFARITRRRGVDLATISLCCMVDSAGRTSFGYGAVGPRPFLVADDSGLLADPGASDASKDGVLRRLLMQASPISDVRGSSQYRAAMLLVMSRRALRSSIERLQSA